MSGGRFEYKQQSLAYEMFGWDMMLDIGDDRWNSSKKARKKNPMDDKEISELVWDVLCLIQSRDWSDSDDTTDDDYREDVKAFKRKWMGRTVADIRESYKEDLRCLCSDIIRELEFGMRGDAHETD